MVATTSHGGAVWWMFTRWRAGGMVYLQGKSCVIHTWALLGWGSHEQALYKCSAFTTLYPVCHYKPQLQMHHYSPLSSSIWTVSTHRQQTARQTRQAPAASQPHSELHGSSLPCMQHNSINRCQQNNSSAKIIIITIIDQQSQQTHDSVHTRDF